MPWKKIKVFSFCYFFNKNVLTPFKHDGHVCASTMLYMFVNCICTKYIRARIHQKLNPKPHGNTLNVMDQLQTSGKLQDKTSFIDPSTGVDLLKGCSPNYLLL
jgi:hypothetical protein